MPDTGAPWNLPYPSPSDDPDVPGDIHALAVAIGTNFVNNTGAAATYQTLADSYSRSDLYTQDEIDARIPVSVQGVSKVFYGRVTDTPNGAGKIRVVHGAGFTPDDVMVTVVDGNAQLTASAGRVVTVDQDATTATYFECYVYRNDTGAAVGSAVKLLYQCLKW